MANATNNNLLPPHDRDAEEAVLGSILMDPTVMVEVSDILEPANFYVEVNRFVYRAMLDLHKAGESIDFITLGSLLGQREQLEDCGGEAYIIRLMNAVPTAMNATSYARIVTASAARRRVLQAASKMATLAYNGKESVPTILINVEQILSGIDRGLENGNMRLIRDDVRNFLDTVEAKASDDVTPGMPTGFVDIDNLTGGLQKSDLIIVAGRPGMGKTAFQLGVVTEAAMKHGKRVAMFNLEMSGEQLVMRMIAAQSKIDSQRLRRGQLYEQEWPLFLETAGRFAETKIWVDDTPSLTPDQLRRKCKRLYLEHGLDLVVIDYLQLMYGNRRGSNRVQEISEISRSLKGLARELNVPVVTVSQLSRAVENRQDKRPVLSDLRDSGSIEQDADIVMFIYRDEYYNPDSTDRPNIAEVNIAKHRNGPTGVVDLYWHGKLAIFRNLQYKEVKLNGSGTTHAAVTADQYG